MSLHHAAPRHKRSALAFAAALLIAALGGPSFAAPNTESNAQRAAVDNGYALVQLNGEPLASYVRTKPPQGKKIDFASNTARSYRAQLSARRNDYKAWLRKNVPQARVSGEFDISLNAVAVQLNGASLAQVAASSMVRSAQYQGLYYPNAHKAPTDPDLALVNAPAAWAAAGGSVANAGEGIKVAIIDSGIDHLHPCFIDAGYASNNDRKGDPNLTNNKVIAAKVFNNNAKSRGYGAAAIDSHGTHVAGTVACNHGTPATVEGAQIPHTLSGVAPRALLGNYNVFPATVEDARSEDILNALEAAYEDGFDIANMSLGGGASGIQDLLTIAVDNLDAANMVVSISQGNNGPGARTVGSPGSAARALTAGGVSIGHQVVSLVKVGAATYVGVKGEFGSPPAGGLSAPLAVIADPASEFGGLSIACAPLAAPLNGAIALVSRGVCDFAVKMRNVQTAGGAGAIVVDRAPGAPFTMGADTLPNPATIPGYLVALEHRATLMASGGLTAVLPDKGTYQYDAAGDDVIYASTSYGPTDVDFRIKPDVLAPAANVLSSIPRSYCNGAPCFAFFNGTSMAAPHLAGSAAIVKQQHPAWSSAQVRSAIVNTAVQGTVKAAANGAVLTDVNIVGAGREDLLKAVNASVALDPVSLSFGAVPSGSAQARTVAVTLTNVSAASQTFALSIADPADGVAFSLSASSVTLAPGASGIVQVTMQASRGAAAGGAQATLNVAAGGGVVAHAMLYTLVK
jgi:minor extracellular serine protease Vpr